MNEFLQNMYGTLQGDAAQDPDGLEKAAAAEMLLGITAEQGIDLSDIDWDEVSTDEIKELIKEASGEAGGQPGAEIDTDEAAQADFMGRVMAHSFYQELDEIEKTAGAKMDAAKAFGKKGIEGAKKGGKWLFGKGRFTEAKRLAGEARTGKGSLGTGKMTKKDRFKALGGAAKNVSPELAALGAAGGGAAYAMRKKSSAVDELAARRAQEWLEAQGVEIEKEAGADFDDAVNQRAYEMLVEAGYVQE